MKIKGIRYTGPIFDNSGYARACRGNILALHQAGVPLNLNPISFEKATPDFGEDGRILKSLVDNGVEYNVNFTHTTPEFWQKYQINGMTNVAFTIWETTKLHPAWPKYINSTVDKVLVGCSWNEEVFKESGVTIPIGVVPHGINMKEFDGVQPFKIGGVKDDDFMFYSIFQWVERKHPMALLKAYFSAFTGIEDVVLVLKTYRSDYSDREKEAIRDTIKRLKVIMPLDHYPKIAFLSNMLTEEEIVGLHARGDCYVSFDRGEGFGLSPFQSGACGNPIIVTGFGGSTEYAKEDNSYLIDYSLTPVWGMPWCISTESLIKTRDGYIKAKNLSEGNELYNKNLNIKTINKFKIRNLNNEEYMLSFKYFSMPSEIEITNNHKLYVLDKNDEPIIKKASDINVGDYLVVPKPSLIPNERDYVDNFGESQMNDLCYLAGLYLAEGHVDRRGYYASFAFNINEKYTLGAECKELMIKLFKIKEAKIYERDLLDRHGYEITFNNKDIAAFFLKYFGTGSKVKFIDNKFKLSNSNAWLLQGYWDGDGHIRKEGYKNKKLNQRRITPECIAETASFSLSIDLRDVMLSLNIVPSLRRSERKDGRVSYVFSISDETFDRIFGIENARRINSRHRKKFPSYFGVLITKKEELMNYDGMVCTISVDLDKNEEDVDNGSYILNGISSSNSPWYRGDQNWAEPNIIDGANKMMQVYKNRDEAKQKGLKLQKYIAENFSWEVIANKIIKEIEEI